MVWLIDSPGITSTAQKGTEGHTAWHLIIQKKIGDREFISEQRQYN